MILDAHLEFGDAESFATKDAETVLFTNQIDLGVAGRDPGNGQPIYLVITVDIEVDSGADGATLQFRLASDDTAVIHATTSTEHLLTEAFVEGNLGQGEKFVFALPIEGLAYEQFLGLQGIVGGEQIDAGAISAFLTLDPTGNKSYPDASN